MAEEKKIRCSFCGKEEGQVRRLIQGPGARICDECIQLCMDILEEDLDLHRPGAAAQAVELDGKIPTPAEIKAVLDQYVIGQESAKVTLAVSVYNHYKRITQSDKGDDVQRQDSVRPDPGASSEGALCHCRRHHPDGGGLCGR